jgi:tight adherence protein B
MPNNETLMVARVFRVQSQTGGDLARILDQLADTIKGRRQVYRKISTLTAEGKMSAWVLMAIPVGLGLFIATTQETMGHALLYTPIGHMTMLVVAGLETGAYFWLANLLRIKV